MSKVIVPCDNCNNKFVVRKPNKKVHKDALEGSLTIYYISCTNCKKKFVSFVESEKIKKLVQENKARKKKLDTIIDEQEYIKALEEFESKTKRIDTLRKDLIFRFSKYV